MMAKQSFTYTYNFVNALKNAFVMGLRSAFSTIKTGEQFKYIVDSNGEVSPATLITIYKGFPRKILKYPALAISCAGGKDELTLDDEFLEEIKDDNGELIGERYLGRFWFETTITVMGRTPLDREQVTDLVLFYLKVLRVSMRKAGIQYQSPKVGAETEKTVGNDNVYMQNITYTCLVEWSIDYSSMEYDKLNKIDITAYISS